MDLFSLPEMATHIAKKFGGDADAIHRTIRAFRDRGYFDLVRFEGRKALYDGIAMGKIVVALALAEHGLEGLALGRILRHLDNHNAPPVPDTPQRAGFARVVEGIKRGEQWSFRFSSSALKSYLGGCRLDGEDSYSAVDDPEMRFSIGSFVVTSIDLTALISPFIGDD